MLRVATRQAVRRSLTTTSTAAAAPTRSRKVLKTAAGALAITGATAGAYFTFSEDALGARRQGQFWGRVFPIVFDYYWNLSGSSPYVKYQKWLLTSKSTAAAAATATEGDSKNEEQQNDLYKEQRKARMEKLHNKHAPAMLQVMLDLKGLYVKLGQVLSVTALPIPEAYRVRFRTLQSDVPGWEDYETVVKPLLEKEFGVDDLGEIFHVVNPVPCGAASIGQAHQATLKNNGANNNNSSDNDEVIIKVQYPDAAWQVPADIQCVGDFLKLCVWAGVVDESAARLSFNEFARQFLAELDYGAERNNLQEIYDSSIAPASPYLKRGVVVPRVHEELCTSRVITMTYLPGPKLEQEARRQLELLGIDTKKGVGSMVRDVAKDATQVDETNATTTLAVAETIDGVAADPALPKSQPLAKAKQPWQASVSRTVGNIIGVNTALWAVRFVRRAMLWSTAAAVATIQSSSSVAPIPQSWNDWAESHRTASEQAHRLALTESWIDTLFDVHGHQIFQLGLFNADPHPGNILVLEEEGVAAKKNPRLGLIDFGQCKRLTPHERVQVANLILSVANNESKEKVAASFRKLGVQTKNDSTEFLSDFAYLMFGPLQPHHLDHGWHKKLHELDRVDYFPKELSMVYRTSLLLRGLALSLQVNASVGEHWRQHAQAAVDEFGHTVAVTATRQLETKMEEKLVAHAESVRPKSMVTTS